jgi:hypothetical protein
MYWESPSKVLDMSTSEILSNFTDVDTTLGTHISVLTEQILAWVPALVISLRKPPERTLDLSRSVRLLFIRHFLLHTRFHINNSTKHKKWIFFHTTFFWIISWLFASRKHADLDRRLREDYPEGVWWRSDQLQFDQVQKFDLLEFSDLEKLNQIKSKKCRKFLWEKQK